MVRQRLWPQWIDLEHRRLHAIPVGHHPILQNFLAEGERGEQYQERDTNQEITFRLHAVLLQNYSAVQSAGRDRRLRLQSIRCDGAYYMRDSFAGHLNLSA